MEATKIKNVIEFLKEETGKFLKVFMFLYIGVLLVLAIITMGQDTGSHIEAKTIFENTEESTEKIFIGKQNSIVIPKIKIEAPIILVDSTQPEDFIEPLKNGVTHYPSSLPGESGEIIILGHSSPPLWPKINYDWVFSDLNKLETGDKIYVYFNNRQYQYIVKEKIFLQKGQDLPSSLLDDSKSKLLLISCWPPGIDNKRIVLYSELVD